MSCASFGGAMGSLQQVIKTGSHELSENDVEGRKAKTELGGRR